MGRQIKVFTSAGCEHVLCPFFWGFSTTDIRCEGIVDDCRIILSYKRKEPRVQQMSLYCEGRFECCEIYRMLVAAKYDDDDEDE